MHRILSSAQAPVFVLPKSKRHTDSLEDRGEILSWETHLEMHPDVQRMTSCLAHVLSQRMVAENNNDSYCLSMAYYLFTGRKGLWVYFTDQAFALICWHPNVHGRILIFPPIGLQRNRVLDEVLKILPPPPNGAQIVRLTPDNARDLTFWKSHRLREYEEPVLDWIFPCHVIDAAKVAGLRGNRLGKVRQNLNVLTSKHRVRFEPLILSQHRDACLNAVFSWASSKHDPHFNHDNFCGPYEALLEMLDQPFTRVEGLALEVDGTIRGCVIWEKAGETDNLANYYGCIASRDVNGLSEFGIHAMCRVLHDQGIEFVNLGGSESAGLDRFKRKFQPVESYSLVSLEVAEFSQSSIRLIA